jgi:hypothetical protein
MSPILMLSVGRRDGKATSHRSITSSQLGRQLIFGPFVPSNKRKANVSFYEPFRTIQKGDERGCVYQSPRMFHSFL